MNLYIPEVGDELRLLAPWTFDVYNEYRNASLMEFLKDPRQATWANDTNYGVISHVIPAGEILKVDRIYIRKGKGEYSSLTFLWKGARTQRREEPRSLTGYGGSTPSRADYTVKIPAKPVRFWAKLADVNKIIFESV